MKPTVPPSALALLCFRPDGSKVSRREQAELSGVSLRTWERYEKQPWSEWPIGLAERWCAVCGFSLWDWSLDVVRERLQQVDWMHLTPRIKRALKDILKAAGKDPAKYRALAHALSKPVVGS